MDTNYNEMLKWREIAMKSEEQNKALTKELKEAGEENETLKLEKVGLEGVVSAYETKIEQLQKEIAELRKDRSDIIGSKNQQISDLINEVDSFQSQLTSKEEESQRLHQLIGSQKETFDALLKKYNDLEYDRDSYKESCKNMEEEVKRFKEFITDHVINYGKSRLLGKEVQKLAERLLSEERKGE